MIRVLHITAGLMAIASGAVALAAFKGGKLHRRSGMIFVVTMLLMSSSGALLAALKAERLNTAMGVLTFYLVGTALLTVRRPGPAWRWMETVGMLVASVVGVYEIHLGVQALSHPTRTTDGLPPTPAFIFGSMALLAAAGDLRLLAEGTLRGAHRPGSIVEAGGVPRFARARLARHLWRMCAAMFIATGSLFLGQPQVFPKSIRPVLSIPVLLVVLTLIYWLVRVLLVRRSAPGLAIGGRTREPFQGGGQGEPAAADPRLAGHGRSQGGAAPPAAAPVP
jgi:hypothetical protein